MTRLNPPAGSREIQFTPLHSPGSVLAAGGTAGHGHNLPELSTANTPTAASRTHPPGTERRTATPPAGTLTTLHRPGGRRTGLSRVAVSSECSESGTNMFPVADEQLVFGLKCWSDGGREGDKKQHRELKLSLKCPLNYH